MISSPLSVTTEKELEKKQYYPIRIDLFRFPINKSATLDDNKFEYIMWGYYDRALINRDITTLHDLFIDGNSFIELGENRLERQFLAGYSQKPLDDFICCSMPALVISEIKLNEDVLGKKGIERTGYYSTLNLDSVRSEIDAALKWFKENYSIEIEWASLFSLGYNDLLILFKSCSYLPIIKAIDYIKNIDSKTSKYIRSTYSLHGINKKNVNEWNDQDLDKLSIFCSLKPGTYGNLIEGEIKNKYGDLSSEINIQNFSLLGKYDAEVLIEGKEPDCGKEKRKNNVGSKFKSSNLFIGDSLFSITGKLFQKGINYTRTRWLYSGNYQFSKSRETEPDVLNDNLNIGTEERIFRCENNLQDPWPEFNKIKDYLQQSSLGWSFQALLDFFWQTKNNEIINYLLVQEFNQVLCDIIGTIQKTKEIECNSGKKATMLLDKNSLECSVFYLAELLQDWVQSARTIFEGPSYNIQFINSSSKVYISYYEIVNSIERIINNRIISKHDYPQPLPNYFVMIHHSDKIKSQSLFTEISDHTKTLVIPILITRELFFSPREGFPLIFHEMGHYVSYDVEKRNIAFIETICEELARQVFNVLVGGEANYVLNKSIDMWSSSKKAKGCNVLGMIYGIIWNELDSYIPAEIKKKPNLRSLALGLLHSLRDLSTLHSDIIDSSIKELDEKFVNFPNSMKEKKDYLKYKIDHSESIAEFIPIIKDEASDDINKIIDKLNTDYCEKTSHLLGFCEKIANAILDFGEGTSLKDGFPENVSDAEKEFIANYFAEKKFHEKENDNSKFLQEKLLKYFQSVNYQEIINIYKDLFHETTADLLMIKTMGYDNFNDYDELIKQVEQRMELSKEARRAREMRITVFKQNWGKIFSETEPHTNNSATTTSEIYTSMSLGFLVEYLGEFNRILEKEYVPEETIRDITNYCKKDSSYNDFELVDHFFNKAMERGKESNG